MTFALALMIVGVAAFAAVMFRPHPNAPLGEFDFKIPRCRCRQPRWKTDEFEVVTCTMCGRPESGR